MYAVLRLNAEQVETLCKDVSDNSGKMVRLANRNTPDNSLSADISRRLKKLLKKPKRSAENVFPLL